MNNYRKKEKERKERGCVEEALAEVENECPNSSLPHPEDTTGKQEGRQERGQESERVNADGS